jgi:hypothetical protein
MPISQIVTNSIANGAVVAADLAAGAALSNLGTSQLADANMAPGSVIQVVSAQYNTQVAFSSNSYQSLFSASITPISTSSRILVIATVAFSGKGSFTVYRGGTDLFPSMKAYAVFAASDAGQTEWNSASIRNPLMISTVDSPSSTSSLTYTMYGRSYGAAGGDAGGINELGGGYQGTSLVLMEISG